MTPEPVEALVKRVWNALEPGDLGDDAFAAAKELAERVKAAEAALEVIARTDRHHDTPKDMRLGYEIARGTLAKVRGEAE